MSYHISYLMYYRLAFCRSPNNDFVRSSCELQKNYRIFLLNSTKDLSPSGNQFHTSFTKLFCFSGKIVPGVCFYFGRRIFSSAGAFFLRPAHVYIHRSRIFPEMYVCKRKCRIFHSARITSNFFTFPNSGFPSDKECWDASKRLSDYDGLPTLIIVDRAVTWSNQKELLLFHFSFES